MWSRTLRSMFESFVWTFSSCDFTIIMKNLLLIFGLVFRSLARLKCSIIFSIDQCHIDILVTCCIGECRLWLETMMRCGYHKKHIGYNVLFRRTLIKWINYASLFPCHLSCFNELGNAAYKFHCGWTTSFILEKEAPSLSRIWVAFLKVNNQSSTQQAYSFVMCLVILRLAVHHTSKSCMFCCWNSLDYLGRIFGFSGISPLDMSFVGSQLQLVVHSSSCVLNWL